MSERKAPLFARVVVDGVKVRATKGTPSQLAKRYPAKAAYPIEVDGVLRGYLLYQQPGYHSYESAGWVLASLMIHGDRQVRLYKSIWTGPRAAKDLLGRVPAYIAAGQMPTLEEAEAKMEVVRRADIVGRQLQEKRAADDNAKRERDRIAYDERTREMIDGLLSMRDRADLTNLERVAIGEAMRRLHIRESVDG